MSASARLTSPSGKKAELCIPLPSGRIQCTACARRCQIGEGQIGLCGVRGVVGGDLYLLNYGRIITGHIDPIEKKPVIHYKPGSKIFSIATTGCNWLCRYCFAAETPITTDHGIMTIQEIFDKSDHAGEIGYVDGIRVLSHSGKFQTVEKAFRHEYAGKMLKIRPYYLPEIRCTPNHQLFTFNAKTGRLDKKRADQLREGDLLAMPKQENAIASERIDTLQVLNEAVGKVERRGKRRASWTLHEKDGRLIFGLSRNNGIPRYLALDELTAEFLGLYCAEGSVIRNTNRPNSWTTVLSFGKAERKLIERAKELLKIVLGVTGKEVDQPTTTQVVVGNNALGLLLHATVGDDCYSKRVPEFIMHHESTNILSAFLKAYISGDGFSTGSRNEHWVGTTSVSRTLTLGAWYVMSRLGYAPRFYVAENEPVYEIEDRTVTRSNDYMTRVLLVAGSRSLAGASGAKATKMIETPHHTLVPIRSIRSEEYTGHVYNMEVADEHSYCASFVAVSNCQNADISQRRKVEGIEMSPKGVVDLAVENGCEGIAYTYNEPSIFIEYARDVGKKAHEKGIFNIFVSNGFDTPESVAVMGEFLDCLTVDFKGSGETGFVRKYIGIPNAEPIFQTLLEVKQKTKIHVEITDLIVPKVGDDIESARKLARWVNDNLGPDTPIHFLRFHPDYKMMDIPVTPVKTLEKHAEVAKKEGLRYVYIGNVPGHPAENTYCPGCGKVLIDRNGYELGAYNLDARNRCVFCGYQTPIVGPLSKSAHEERFRLVVG
jgi:pyruvate formate lyase activating enzyme